MKSDKDIRLASGMNMGVGSKQEKRKNMAKQIEEVKEEAKQYIGQNRFNEAINLLNEFIADYELDLANVEKKLLLISGDFFDINERENKGLLAYEDASRIKTNLKSRFLNLLDDLNGLKGKKLRRRGGSSETGLVSADLYSDSHIYNVISKAVKLTDKIENIKIKIEDIEIEISKTNDKQKIKELNEKVTQLEQNLKEEKTNYSSVKSELNELKQKYQKLQNGNKSNAFDKQCNNCNNKLANGDSICQNCGYENNDLKMIRSSIDSFKSDFEFLVEEKREKDKILKEVKKTNSLILGYLDALNRRITNLEKKIK